MRTILRLLALVIMGLFIFVQFAEWQFKGGSDMRRTAISQFAHFLKACAFYRLHNDGKLPAKLSDLVAPPWGGRSLLAGGESELIDPWGKPYRYVVIETEAGTEAYVWAEWEYQGKLSNYGAKLSADDRIRNFNLPTD